MFPLDVWRTTFWVQMQPARTGALALAVLQALYEMEYKLRA